MNRIDSYGIHIMQKRQPGLMRELEKKYTPVKDFISQLKNIMQPASRQEARKLFRKKEKKSRMRYIRIGKVSENGNFDFKVYGNCARGRWDEYQWRIN